MTTSASLAAVVNEVWLHAALHASSPADPSCNVSEVSRLLWTVIVVSVAAGAVVALRPTWRRVAGVAAAGLTWTWIDMEGPTLISWGTHGLHVADVPVVVALAAGGAGALRLVLRRASARR